MPSLRLMRHVLKDNGYTGVDDMKDCEVRAEYAGFVEHAYQCGVEKALDMYKAGKIDSEEMHAMIDDLWT